jgi:hypothetical protein
MKRTLYDSEYDRIRKAAGLARPQYEFDEFEGREAPPSFRVDELNDDFKQRMAERSEHEKQKEAAAKANHDAWHKGVNDRMIRREYESLGITPPEPLVSLSMLRKIGWTIEQIGDRNVLMRPLGLQPLRSQEEC